MNLMEIIELGKGLFCLLDIETTGFSPTSEEITEIAAIRVNRDFEVVAEISRLVRIDRRVPWHITQLNGITDTLLASEGGPLPVALQDIHEFLGGQPTFAHNARFDSGFLNAAARREELMIHFPLEGSIPIFKRLLPSCGSYGLEALAESLDQDAGVTHRALADCVMLLNCLKQAHLGAGLC